MKKIFMLLLLLGYLGLWRNHLALYENGSVYILPYAASLYSREDLNALTQGLPYRSPQERAERLEDFTS